MEFCKADVVQATAAWRAVPADPPPLLVHANLSLLPLQFRAAFGLPSDAAEMDGRGEGAPRRTLLVAGPGRGACCADTSRN